MGAFSIWHWIIVLTIVVLVFGTKKLRNLGGDLGSALKGFKDGMKESETENNTSQKDYENDQILEVGANKETSSDTAKANIKEEQREPVNIPKSPAKAKAPLPEAATQTPKKTKTKNETEKEEAIPTSVNSQITDAEFKGKSKIQKSN